MPLLNAAVFGEVALLLLFLKCRRGSLESFFPSFLKYSYNIPEHGLVLLYKHNLSFGFIAATTFLGVSVIGIHFDLLSTRKNQYTLHVL